MNSSKLLELVESQIENRIELEKETLARNTCEDFGSYKYRCGVIWGLRAAILEIDEAVKKYLENDDD